jgi:N-glycosylase/DNA lyase
MAQRVIEKLSRVLKVEGENKTVVQNILKTLNHLRQTRSSKVLKPTGRKLD